MEFPEISDFPAPKSQCTYIHHEWDDPKREITWKRVIDQHNFNTKVLLLLPNAPTLPPRIKEDLTVDTQYYLVKKVPLTELCKPIFQQAFIQRGQFYALSCDTCLDIDNSAAMTPDGYIHLLVNKFVYQEIQIHGTLSSTILRHPHDKFVIRINTQEKYFRPGKSSYEKVVSGLSHPELYFNLWITWRPNKDEICPSSVAKYFHDLGYVIEEKMPSLSENTALNVALPRIDDGKMNAEDLEPQSVLEWIGCQTLGINLESKETNVCELVKPETYDMVNNLNLSQCCGFYSPAHIISLINNIRSWLLEQSSTAVPWISITVYGHPDSLINWGHQEHSSRTSGDNFYTLIIQRDNVHVFKNTCYPQPLRYFRKGHKGKKSK